MTEIDLATITLEKGAHKPAGKFCVMELAAYLAHEKWSDHPKCVSPVIGAFLRSWNDALNDDDRQMLKPYAQKVLHTKGRAGLEIKRAWIATDWLVRECTPGFLRLAGLTEHAETLEKLAALTGTREARSAQVQIDAAWAAARAAAWAASGAASGAAAGDAAWAAAGAASGAAAWDAAWAAARAAAGDAAGAAARAAARAAAWAAARDAARAAARDALAPTVKILQASALQMLDRMIIAGEVSAVQRFDESE